MWIYEQKTGNLFSPKKELIATGYAGGNCGKNPEGKNNPDMQWIHNIGPLPQGDYTIGKLILESKLGPYVMPLEPYPENDMRGRGHFFIHGDKIGHIGEGSEGCIIMPRSIRLSISESDDKHLKVIP